MKYRIPVWMIVVIGLLAAVAFWGFIGWAVVEALDILRDATDD